MVRAWDETDYSLTLLGQEQFTQNLGIVFSCAKRSYRYYRNRGILLTMEEVVSACCHGMVRAIHEWEPERGALSTCAYKWMRNHVQREANAWSDAQKLKSVTTHRHSSNDVLDKMTAHEDLAFNQVEAAMDVQTMLDRVDLTDKQKERLSLTFSGHTLKEIAAQQDVAFQNIQLSNAKALKKLQQYVGV